MTAAAEHSAPLLTVEALSCYLQTAAGLLTAVDKVSFSLFPAQTHALLGESGCGKSITALALAGLLPDNALVGAASRLHFAGTDLLNLPESKRRALRGKKIAMIFQEPMTSLNPVLSVKQQLLEVLPPALGKQEAHETLLELLTAVGIAQPQQKLAAYPHQLSGGMKQRIMIAMALACQPDVLIADEPTTALDVTTQAQILALLQRLQQQQQMAILLISHDLSVVEQMADTVAVMYAGQIIEQADKQTFFQAPQHPYSQALFHSLPKLAARQQRLQVMAGQVPLLTEHFTRCRFLPRCPQAQAICQSKLPDWITMTRSHAARCHFAGNNPQTVAATADSPSLFLQNNRQLVDIPSAMRDYPGGESQFSSWSASARSARTSRHSREASSSAVRAEVAAAPEPTLPHTVALRVSHLQVHFAVKKGWLQRSVAAVKAVDGLSITLLKGRTTALVGESGCGKTTLAKTLLQLHSATASSIEIAGQQLHEMSRQQRRQWRRKIQIIFQDPYSSLNPRMRVCDIISEGLRAQKLLKGEEAIAQCVQQLLQQVGLAPEHAQRYPHQFSGGQRQRIAIARALALQPDILICDEPTSALDVSVQAQVLNLLRDLQQQLGLTLLFISHNLAVVAYLADELAVMYGGRIVESGPAELLLQQPLHPYTQNLLQALDAKLQHSLPAAPATTQKTTALTGCHYAPRCPLASELCHKQYPEQQQSACGQQLSCHQAQLYTQSG